MEDTHGGENAYSYPCSIYTVLILIIMEDTHGGDKPKGFDGAVCSLNPYYNGRYSWRGYSLRMNEFYMGLNPYYNGRYSWSP